jgi:hypothetical protein
MKIEFKTNSILIDQEQLYALVSIINSSLAKKKNTKRRKRKAKVTAGDLIQEIMDDIEI